MDLYGLLSMVWTLGLTRIGTPYSLFLESVTMSTYSEEL